MNSLLLRNRFDRGGAKSCINLLGIMSMMVFILSCDINSEIVTREAKLEAFKDIVFNFPCEVFLNETTDYKIKLVGDEEMLNNTEYKVVDSVLYIDNTSNLNFTKPRTNIVELYIDSGPLSRIEVEQTCNIQTVSPITSDYLLFILKSKANSANLELDCKTFYYVNGIPCGGKIFLRGKAENVTIRNKAIMSVDAKNLQANSMDIVNMSKGDCQVRAVKSFKYGIEGIGNIHLFGSPEIIIQTDITSTGRLIRHE